MTRIKSGVITFIVALALFCVLYLSSSYAIRWYNSFKTVFATYGYIQAIYVFYMWLREPSAETRSPKHVEDPDVASGKTIPNSWLNPFKKVKENKEHAEDSTDNQSTSRGLLYAGNQNDRAGAVPGGTVVSVRTGNGSGQTEPISENGTAAG